LLVFVIFFFAIVFVKLQVQTDDGCFEGLLMAMHCLTTQGVFADQATMINDMLSLNMTSYVAFLLYLLLETLTVLNLFIGVCCDVINRVGEAEGKHRRLEEAQQGTLKMVQEFDDDGNNSISMQEFRELCVSERCQQQLRELEIDVEDLWELADFIFFEKDEIGIEEFQKHIMQLRGSNIATVKDIVDMRKFFLEEIHKAINGGRPSRIEYICADADADGSPSPRERPKRLQTPAADMRRRSRTATGRRSHVVSDAQSSPRH